MINQTRFTFLLVSILFSLWLTVFIGFLTVGTFVDPKPGRMVVLFTPSNSHDRVFKAVNAAGGYLMGGDVAGSLWTVQTQDPNFVRAIRAQGALAVWDQASFNWMFSSGCTSAVGLTRA